MSILLSQKSETLRPSKKRFVVGRAGKGFCHESFVAAKLLGQGCASVLKCRATHHGCMRHARQCCYDDPSQMHIWGILTTLRPPRIRRERALTSGRRTRAFRVGGHPEGEVLMGQH